MTWRPQVTEFDLAYGRRVREARQACALTQSELAHRLGLTRSSIANLEAGRQSSTVERAVDLAKALNASIQWLLTGDNTAEIGVAVEPAITRSRLTAIASCLSDALDEIDAAIPAPEVPDA